MLRLLLLGLLALKGSPTAEQFENCICPPVDDYPEIGQNMDPGTGCPKGDSLAAEIKIENYGDFLIATSLNLRLSRIPELSEKEKQLPLYLVSDVIRIDKPIEMYESKVTAFSRILMIRPGGNITRPSDFEFHSKEVEIHDQGQVDQHSLNIDDSDVLSNEAILGLHQLVDFVEYKAVTTDTFDTRNAACPGIKKSAKELDSLTSVFGWLRTQARIANDKDLLRRINLLQRYRGSSLEGPALHQVKDSNEIKLQMNALFLTISNRFEQLVDQMDPEVNDGDINSLLASISELISSTVSEEIITAPWSKRLSLFTKIRTSLIMNSDIEDPNDNEDLICKDMQSYWPKENDFEDLKYRIISMFRKPELKGKIQTRDKLIQSVRDIEQFYHLKNIVFELRLNELRKLNRKTVNRHKTNYEKRLDAWENQQRSVPANYQDRATAYVLLEHVPVSKFIVGEFTQRYWISDQRFNNYAHLKVHDIKISIEGLSNNFVREHLKMQPLTSILYDIDENGNEIKYTALPTEYPLDSYNSPVTPFTRWRFIPDTELIESVKNDQTIKMTLEFMMKGKHVEGLTGLLYEEEDCSAYDDNPSEFALCKYGGKDAFHLTYDIVNVMHLREINNLFALKYENQQNGEDSGVITEMSTNWSEPYTYECENGPFGLLKEIRRSKISTVLSSPKMYFPPELPGYMQLYYDLNNAEVSTESRYVHCDTGEELPTYFNNATLSGAIALTISLEKVKGVIEDDEDVILDFSSTAITTIDFSMSDPLFTSAIETLLVAHFKEHFTAVQLATIKYNPLYPPPVFVQPSKFFFQTVCTDCSYVLGEPDDKDLDGYLITVYQTKSINHIEVQYPSDPYNTYGLNHAIPARAHTAGVFLGAHITFCDIYYSSFEEGGYIDDMFVVVKEQSSDPNKPTWQELFIKYGSDMCIQFGEEQFKDEGVMSIYQDSFKFNSLNRGVQNHISNAITNQPENSGRNLGNLLAGFDDGVKACGESDCDTWWKWLLSPGICLFDMLVVCIIDWIGGTSTVWEGSTIAIYKTETTPLEYLPDCYSFQFPAMTFSPTVDITLDGPQPHDLDIRDDTVRKVKTAAQNVLAVKFTESPSVSLFTAVNLLFPGMKVISNATFFSPGTIVMFGDIVGEYIEQPEFGPECPQYDFTSGKFIRF